MRSFDQWLSDYGVSHQNQTNRLIHKFCVPMITFNISGLLWAIPKMSFFPDHAFFNWSTLLSVFLMIFYFKLNKAYCFYMFVIIGLMQIVNLYTYHLSFFFKAHLLAFVISWVFQFIGHKIEGMKPSIFDDLCFLFIGPLWVLKSFINH